MIGMLKRALPVAAVVAMLMGMGVLRARAEDAAGSVITGKVVDKEGNPVADAKVNLMKPRNPDAPRDPNATRPEPLASATSDKDGKFSLAFDKAKVADGDYNVGTRVQDKGFGRAKVTIKDGKADPAEVTLTLQDRRPGGGGAGGGRVRQA